MCCVKHPSPKTWLCFAVDCNVDDVEALSVAGADQVVHSTADGVDCLYIVHLDEFMA